MPRTHKTLPRLFVAEDLRSGATVTLGRDPANYLVNVLRKRAGDGLILFNGRDGAWRAELAAAGKKTVSLTLVEQTAPQSPRSDLWYGFAPLKAARLDYMIQKATEMGVGMIQPVVTRHTQVTRLKPERLRANAVEAAEQCEVLNVPDILPVAGFENLLESWPEFHGERRLILADESAPSASPLATLQTLAGQPIGLLIGPEGGFSADERARLRGLPFVTPISLGPRILRADTAAVAALAVIQSIIGDWR